jgi:hypothetical protein
MKNKIFDKMRTGVENKFLQGNMRTKWRAVVMLMALTASFILTSCETDLDIKTDDYTDRIVINSIFNNRDTLAVEVTKTFPPYGKANIEEIEKAKVSVFREGQFVEDLVYVKREQDSLGRFVASFIPEPEKNYSIEVTDSKIGKATSASYVPGRFEVTGLSAVKTEWGEDNITSMRFNFKFTLHDPEASDQYYLTIAFPVLEKNEATGEWEFFAFQYCEILTGDLPLHQLYLRNGLLFKDDAFNGTAHVVSGSATTYRKPFGDFDIDFPPDPDKYKVDSLHMHISVHRLSPELYLFCSSYATVLKNENNIYSEPAPVYSNVENGTGIFGGEYVIDKVVDTK